jgi:uncharacterized protein (TIGR02996 family)
VGVWDTVRGWFGGKPTSTPPVEQPPPAAPPPALPLHRDRALENAIARDRNAVEPYLIYADWLNERGDPRGELISVMHALSVSDDGDEVHRLQRRKDELLREHGAHLLGGAIARGIAPILRLGFVRHVTVHRQRDLDLAEVLADHPAIRFVESLSLAGDAKQMEVLPHLKLMRFLDGRDIRLVDEPPADERRVLADVEIRRGADDRLGVNAEINARLLSVLFDRGYVARTRAGARTWWYGNGAWVSQHPTLETSPRSGEVWLAPWEGTIPFRVEVRFHPEDRWLAGELELRAEPGRRKMILKPCAAIDEPPFVVAEPPRILPAGVGPSLVDGAAAHAVLPGVGVYDRDTSSLITEGGRASALVLPSEIVPWVMHGSAAGLIAIVVANEAGMREKLWFADVKKGAPRSASFLPILAGAFDERGERFAAVLRAERPRLAIFDARRAVRLVESEMARVEPDDEAPFVGWHGGEAFAFAGGMVTFLVEDGAVRFARAAHAVGVGELDHLVAPSYHPGARRTAWMVCVELPDEGRAGSSIIGWCDEEGAHGNVIVPDGGEAGAGFGNTAVLRDGRVVAIGTRVWLIDPATAAAQEVGAAGAYPAPLPITYAANGIPRLWSRGRGPWWIDLPERR